MPALNGIGEFEIGVSPIGTVSPVDWFATVISQYANSPTLLQLIESFWGYLDQTANFDAFFDDVWNIDTARGWGLDVWGRILGVGRVIPIPDGQFFGFAQASDAQTFGEGPLYAGVPSTSNFALSDAAYRLLLLAKAAANITDGSIPSLNRILGLLFPFRGRAYVEDGLDMTLTYVFEFTLTPAELAIVSQPGILPTPAGVTALLDYP